MGRKQLLLLGPERCFFGGSHHNMHDVTPMARAFSGKDVGGYP